jgi:rhodanese-related sulfurtransferase
MTTKDIETKELVSLPQFASWRVPQMQGGIEYPLDLMEEIRAFVCDELLQVSRGGHEVGGVLFGTRREGLIRILTWRPIACEQAQGESFVLTPSDRMNLAVQLELARQNADLKDLRPVGCFLSHLQEGVCLAASDVETYNGFFPESWQVALVICPKGERRAQAGFFFREAGGKLETTASYQNFELQPFRSTSVNPAPAAGSLAPAVVATPPAAKPEPKREEALAATPPSPVLPAGAKPEPPMQDDSDVSVPFAGFQTEERMPAKERWMWAVPVLLAIGIAAFVLYERPMAASNAIGLRATADAQTVQLAWDTDSRALRNSTRGELDISDGGASSKILLTGEQLRAGKVSYQPQSADVDFEMIVYPANGAPLQDSTRMVLAGFRPPTQPPQLLPADQAAAPQAATAVPPDPASATAGPALEQQVRELKEELAKERARGDELENLVRILENRLSLPGGKPNAAHQP